MKNPKEDGNIVNKKNYFLVNHGIKIIMFTAFITLFSLYMLKLNGKSILELVFQYYLNKK